MNDPVTQQAALQEQFVEEAIPVGLPWRILVFAGVIFALSIFIAVGLKFGYEQYLDTKVSDMDQKIKSLTASVTEEKQQQFVAFYSQVVNLKAVLEKRSFTSNAFTFVEKNVIGSVYFTDAEMSASAKTIGLRGYATNLESLSQQIATFEKSSSVKNVILDDVTLQPQGGVTFKVSISFQPTFLQAPIASQ